MQSITVIGAGAAGIIAAWRAASLGAQVLLLERNTKPGIKLLISGGGKCNITHAGSMEEVRSAFLPREARFLKPSFFKFTNDDIVQLIETAGVKTYARPNGRVFPASGDADDVVNALVRTAREAGVELRTDNRVTGILATDSQVLSVMLGSTSLKSKHVILATGGASYPKTGTTGDGFAWAASLGHTIVPVRPALAPIGVEPLLPAHWRGIALRDGLLMVFADGKKIDEWAGDILFSHEGITGPAALEVSRSGAEAMRGSDVELRFDFFPGKDFSQVDEEVNRLILSQRDKMLSTILEKFLPNRMVPDLLRSIHVAGTKRGHVVTREERRLIVQLLKDWKVGNVSVINIERGEVTAGGVSLDEVDPKTLRSRIVRGLYVCGEVLDVAGPVGGYNLQAAFSTGFVAGETAARDWLASAKD